jgi:hypothetical protein
MGQYVGRQEYVGQLLNVLQGAWDASSRLVIQSIEGPGGIGKTALFEHVLDKVDRGGLRMLTMRVSGGAAKQVDTFQLVQALVNASETSFPLAKPLSQRFTSTAEVHALFVHITAQAKAALQEALPQVPVEKIMKVIEVSVQCGHRLNSLSPATRRYVDFETIRGELPAIEQTLKSLAPLLEEAPGVLEKLGLRRAAALRNALRANPLDALAEALVTDLTTLLVGYERKNLLSPSQTKVQGVDRLLLVVDDYESLASQLGEFLVSHLIPRLKQASFQSTLVVIGRDQLALTHPAWSQHHQRLLAPPVSLSALGRSEMDELVKTHGRTSNEDAERAWADTLGYPLLVKLWLEEAREATAGQGPSVGMLKRFHDRTTHWLTAEQKRWLDHALFLEKVNVETFTHALGNVEEARRAMAWFESDGSVRDAQGRVFRVREYVRSRLADYLEVTDPARFRDLIARSGHNAA